MTTIDDRTAPLVERFRYIETGRFARHARRAMAIVSAMLALAVPLARATAQSAPASVKDSAALHRSAVAAVHAYELAAFHYWPATSRPCTPGGSVIECAGGWCEPSAGRARCLMGRVV